MTIEHHRRRLLSGVLAIVGAGVNRAADVIVCTFEVTRYCGRGFEELRPARSIASTELGAHLARAAWMEAASVTAFRRVARELAAHGAPRDLVAAARAAARDEARHARAMRALARREGARVPRVRHARFARRSLEAIAIENATEACVGETFGAALAVWQARHARDPEIREAMFVIAEDEVRHAALGHAIADWLDGELTAAARARVDGARRMARETLVAQLRGRAQDAGAAQSAASLALGLPAPDDAVRFSDLFDIAS